MGMAGLTPQQEAQMEAMLRKGQGFSLPCGCILSMRRRRGRPEMSYEPCPAHIGLAAQAAQLEAS